MARTLPRRPAAPPLPLVLLLLLLAAPGAAQQAPPSPADVLGYELGERFTPHAGALRYAEALAAASDRVRLTVYGTTTEGHELMQMVIARPDHLERLDGILAANRELTRPETSEARAREIAAANPAVVYFTYGVHGNESSSTEAALWTAWDLARGAPEAEGVLDSLVVVVDPVANPDGRERYVRWFRSVVGERANPSPQAREHSEPWPGGRYNHYLFDLNRDWAWATQPETRARLATWDRWNPQVHVDFHEMWYQSSYFFFPATAPINPIYPDHVLEWGRRFGEANARAFDARGWRYYTAEDFDLFYPGYGDSWPSLTGAVGMTYEQAGHGAAGLAIAREAQGDTLTLRERATHHRAAGLATLRAAAAGRTRLLADYAEGQRSVGRGEPDYLLVPTGDGGRTEEVAELLRRQGIEVERASSAFSARAAAHPGFSPRARFPEGTLRVRARQPRGRLATTLLQPETELRGEYSYDVSAWALPYAFGVPTYRASALPDAGWTPVPAPAAGEAVPAAVEPAEAGYGYLVAPEAAPAGIVRFLSGGGRVRVLRRPSTLGGRRWPAGSWFIPAAGNDSLRARVARSGLGAAVVPVATGLSEDGIDLGSENVPVVRLPRVAVLTGEGISPTSFGAAWHYLEREAELPFDAVRTEDVTDVDLGEYDVVVLPEAGGVEEPVKEALTAWVRAGGRLVALGGGARAVASIAEVEMRQGDGSEQPEEGDDVDQRARLLEGREARQRREWREEVPGVILPVRLDPAHPLAWGAGVGGEADRAFVLHQGARVFEPAEGLEAVAFFPEGVERISGVISPENLERVGQGVWLGTKRVGSGSVVLFADDPLFRMFWRSTQPMFLNAVLLGPGV